MIEVLKQALEALEQWNTPLYKRGTVIETLRQAIAELESQEPVALVIDGVLVESALPEKYTGHLYTTPPQRTEQEQPLPPVEIGVDVTADGASVVAFYRRPNAVMEMFYSQFHPAPQRPWVGLTDEEKDYLIGLHIRVAQGAVDAWIEGLDDFIQAIEAKLKEKNNG